VRVCVLTTSYPRSPDDISGVFVAAQVARLRERGHEVAVVSPASFRHFGIAYGDGITQNLRARPWLLAALPLFGVSFARAARRSSRDADVVEAHWIPSALAALATRKPFVLQVWGTDVELARRVSWLVRPLVRRARIVIAASEFLAARARELGAQEVRVIPNGLELPEKVSAPDEPPHVLFAGRLSEEKGVLEFIEATAGLPRAIAGDGPLRASVPGAAGFVAPELLSGWYDRAAVVCVPSRREGYGMVAREAMAHGRPVVATAVGGLVDAVVDGITGLLVAPGDTAALKRALDRLLGDPGLRAELGANARRRAEESYSWEVSTTALVAALEFVALEPPSRRTT
jgi:glycosyltransferase involved in cell wall biosynthesis